MFYYTKDKDKSLQASRDMENRQTKILHSIQNIYNQEAIGFLNSNIGNQKITGECPQNYEEK